MPTYRNTYNGRERVSSDALGYPWIEVDGDGELVGNHQELSVMTADAILAEVGNDPDLAQRYLDEEQARDQPRSVLSSKLQRIIDNAGS